MNARRRPPYVGPGRQSGSLMLLNGKWRLRFRLPPDAEGKIRQRSVIIGGVRDFDSFDQARREADRVLDRLAPRRLLPGLSLPWLQWCERYRTTYVPLLRKSSRAVVTSIIDRHIEPSFSHLRTHELTREVLQQWIAAQARANVPRHTIVSRFSVVRSMLNKAETEGVAARAPSARSIALPKRREIRQQLAERAFTDAEMQTLIDAAEPVWFATFLELLARTGVRTGEALALTWRHVDFAAGVIRVRQSASSGEIGPTKSETSRRDVPMSSRVRALLQTWQQSAPANELWLLFPNDQGKPRTSAGVRACHLRPLLKRLRMRARSLHGFRHGAASAMLRAGVSATAVRDVLGHSNLAVTDGYAAASDADRRAAVQALDTFVNSSEGH